MMTEKLFQFIWRYKLFSTHHLWSTEGEPIQILQSGQLNPNAGPDFLEAKIKIGPTIWVGHVELHIHSSDWLKHQHQGNAAYNNLILHVVYNHDGDIQTQNQSHFPTLCLAQHINHQLLYQYERLMNNRDFIPCEKQIGSADPFSLSGQIESMMMERLERKSMDIDRLLQHTRHHWQEVFYIQLAKAFGLHINQHAFEELAKITPWSMLLKHRHSLLQLEALLFGQAGMLYDYFDHPYPLLLQKEYTHLRNLYHLEPMAASQWKFLRLRPANFPTLRIAQLAQLIHQSNHLFSHMISSESVQTYYSLLQVEPSDFWQDHFTFFETSAVKDKKSGKSFITAIIINAVLPTLFYYGKQQGKEELCIKALQFLQDLPFERNSQTESFKKLGFPYRNAADSQALLELKKQYCDQKRCLECKIGYSLLRRNTLPELNR